MTTTPLKPTVVDIAWNKRDENKLQIIGSLLVLNKPVLLNISGVPDFRRILAAKEMDRDAQWAKKISENFEKKEPVCRHHTHLQERVDVSDDKGKTWKRNLTPQEAAKQTGVHEFLILEHCYQRLSQEAANQPVQDSFIVEDHCFERLRFQFGEKRDGVSWQIWYGICRALGALPDCSVGVTTVANATRNACRRWRRVNTSKSRNVPETGTEHPGENAKLRELLNTKFRNTRNGTVELDANEWESWETTDYYVNGKNGAFYQSDGSCKSDVRWHAPSVLHFHLYGSSYNSYRLRALDESSTSDDDSTPYLGRFDAEYACTVGGFGCDGNAILLPAGMLHEIVTHGRKKLVIPTDRQGVQDVEQVLGLSTTEQTEQIAATLDELESESKSKSTTEEDQLLALWKHVPGAYSALHAAGREQGDQQIYLGFETYAVLNVVTAKGRHVAKHTLRRIEHFHSYLHWQQQFQSPELMRELTTSFSDQLRHKGTADTPAVLEDRFPSIITASEDKMREAMQDVRQHKSNRQNKLDDDKLPELRGENGARGRELRRRRERPDYRKDNDASDNDSDDASDDTGHGKKARTPPRRNSRRNSRKTKPATANTTRTDTRKKKNPKLSKEDLQIRQTLMEQIFEMQMRDDADVTRLNAIARQISEENPDLVDDDGEVDFTKLTPQMISKMQAVVTQAQEKRASLERKIAGMAKLKIKPPRKVVNMSTQDLETFVENSKEEATKREKAYYAMYGSCSESDHSESEDD